jgi:hypothetical protein
MEEREFDDLSRELHETRAEPRPEYASELDRRAAEWLREPPRRRLPSLRIAIPAVAAGAVVAVVIALALSGGDGGEGGGGNAQLEVAVVPEKGAAEALGAPLERKDSAARDLAEGGFAPPVHRRVEEGEPVSLRYFFTAPTEGTARLAGREAELDVPEGAGRIEISTEGLPAGAHRLEIAVPAAPLYRERIEIGG